jgi:hypothetical protein
MHSKRGDERQHTEGGKEPRGREGECHTIFIAVSWGARYILVPISVVLHVGWNEEEDDEEVGEGGTRRREEGEGREERRRKEEGAFHPACGLIPPGAFVGRCVGGGVVCVPRWLGGDGG